MITFNDASDLDSAITAAQKIITRQALEPVNIIAETANPDIPPDVVENANNALIRNKISSAVFWDVNQTIRQAQELTRQFPGFSLTVYNDVSDMPADIRQKVVAAGQTPERVRAFIMPDTNDVYLVANKVAPSEVAKTVGHEIIGHRGIRAVFGEDYDNLLDLVYRDHADEINALAAAYRRNPANNVANQRYLTEEFLANCANAKVKPSWWKELIAKIRAWLREYLPNMRFTEQDIEGVLSMASRHLRKNSVVKENLTTDGDMRFLVAGEEGASRLAEAETLLADLATAKTMSAEGKDAHKIKLATGWELGGDGKWRMEIPDLEFKADNFTAPVELNGYLEDLVDAPDFFAAYPALRKIYVMTTDHLPKNVAGRHTADLSGEFIFFNREYFAPTRTQQSMQDEAERKIRLSYNWTETKAKNAQMLGLETNPDILRQQAYNLKDQVRDEQLAKYRRTLIHEVQHSIQGEEGFAEGSSAQYFQDFPVKDNTLFKTLEDAIQTEYKYKKQLAEHPEIYHDAQRYFELDDVYFSDSQIDENAILDEMDQIDDKIRAAGIADLWDKYQIAVRERRAAQLKYDNSALPAQEAYRRTAGEVEARNASRRADMSMEERRQSLLADTADVAEEDKIYLEQLAGGADMAVDDLAVKAEQLKNNIVSEINSNVIKAKDGKTAIQAAMEYVDYLPAHEFDTQIGKVEFDSNSVKESLSHTIYQNKLDAIQAVPDVLTKGIFLGMADDKDGKPIINYYFAGKVKIGEFDKIVFVRTRKSAGRSNRFYVHEVFTEEEIIKLGNQQTDATPVMGRKYRNASELYRNIIAKVLNYKLLNANNEEIKFSDLSDGSDNSDGMRFSVAPDVDTPAFKNWFKDSKVVDENGEPLVVYHGTNWDMLSEVPGEAFFDDKYRSAGSGDNGFFGRGFYFAFGNGKASEGEAGFYGRNVYHFYLSIQKPFYFSESLLNWNNKRVSGDEVKSVEIVNAVKLFPELLKDFTLDTYDKNGDFAGDITLAKYAAMFNKVYQEKKFSIRQSSMPGEIVVECDPIEHTENGHTWIEYGFTARMYKPSDNTDMQLLCTHLYLDNSGFPDKREIKVEIPYHLFREFYGEPEFRSWLEHNGYDGVMQSKYGDEVVAFYPTQIKSATDNIGTFDAGNPDIRFLLSEYSADQTADIVAVLRPYVGYYLAKDDADYQAHLKSLGIDVDVHDAHAFAVLAMRENLADQAARSAEKRKKTIAARNKARSEYLYNSIPLYREAIDFAGTEDFKIKPSARFRGEEFSGSFISPEFVKFSKSKKKDPSKLDAAAGINSDEFAESLARKWGRDALEVEQEIIDFFRDLKKRDLWKEYTDFRNESIMADKEEDRLAREEFEASERARIEDEAMYILENGLPVTDEFISENKKVYQELHRMMFQQEPPAKPRKKDVEAINAALQSDPAAAGEGFAEGYKQGREASRKGFSEKRKADRYKKSLLCKRLLTLALHIGAIAEMLHIVE